MQRNAQMDAVMVFAQCQDNVLVMAVIGRIPLVAHVHYCLQYYNFVSNLRCSGMSSRMCRRFMH